MGGLLPPFEGASFIVQIALMNARLRGKLALISVLATLSAFIVSLYMFWAGSANTSTFSYIGEANRIWFFFYSLLFTSAFCFNILLFTVNTHIKNKRTLLAIYLLLGLTFILSLLQSIIIDPAVREVHILLAALFTGLGSSAIITSIIVKLKLAKARHEYYYLFMLILTGGINFYAIHAYGWLIASYQWLYATTVLATSCALANHG